MNTLICNPSPSIWVTGFDPSLEKYKPEVVKPVAPIPVEPNFAQLRKCLSS